MRPISTRVQIDPNYAIAYLNLGVLCDLYLQQPQRALEAYERYLALATHAGREGERLGHRAEEALGQPAAQCEGRMMTMPMNIACRLCC